MDDILAKRKSAPPVVLQAPELVGRLVMAIVAHDWQGRDVADLLVEPALRLRQGAPAAPLVLAELGGFSALMSTPTARHAAVLIATSPWVLTAHDDPAALGLRFTQAADEADALAAGATPKEPPDHGNQDPGRSPDDA